MPYWLHILSIASLALGAVCAAIIIVDERRHPQHMWIMSVVWPVTALFGGLFALAGYFVYGRLATDAKVRHAMERNATPPNKANTPFPAVVAKGTSHCGAGCMLGDLVAEWLIFFVPAIAIWAGYETIFPEKIYAVWIVDFIFAFALGIAFQYFTIKPMRGLSVGQGIVEAVKADTLSLTSWQVGMYGFMAIAHFWIFGTLLGVPLKVSSAEFWFMMQIAMLAGFATAYPVNWWLIRVGIKEAM